MSAQECHRFVDRCHKLRDALLVEIANDSRLAELTATASLLRELDQFGSLIEHYLYVHSDTFAQEEYQRESNLVECEERLGLALEIWKASIQAEAQGMSRQYSANSTSPDSPFAHCSDDLLVRWTPTQMAQYVALLSSEMSSTDHGKGRQAGDDPTLAMACAALTLGATSESDGQRLSAGSSESSSSDSRSLSPSISVTFSDSDTDACDEQNDMVDLTSKFTSSMASKNPFYEMARKHSRFPLKPCLKGQPKPVSVTDLVSPPRRIVERWTTDDWAQYHAALNSMIRYTSSEGVHISKRRDA